ncbi:MAG: ATP-grasp domain-containing protein [Candidatus Omnitrophota bacterium]|nr:ATP-grasp domain-containing protein [Candidatus Omnitrophota bacterium]
MKVNVLITSASRKVWLVNAFKKALSTEGKGKVVSVDSNGMSAALRVSDSHSLVPYSSDDDFIPSILEICLKEDIKLIVPTRDEELLLFAENSGKFMEKGIRVMISRPEVIRICRDKYEFFRFLEKKNIPTVKTYLPGEKTLFRDNGKYPLIIKPRRGSGGKGVFKAENEDELRFFSGYVKDPVIQEFAEGKEYTIDLFSDFDAKVLTAVPRERIEVFSGESYKSRTVMDKDMIEKAGILAEELGTVGHITIQCIKNDKGIKFIEINPRFGGGAALGFKAGADTPALLVKLISGQPVKRDPVEFIPDVVMLRYTDDIFLDGKTMRQL